METIYYIKLNNKELKQNMAIHDCKTRHRLDFQTQFCRTDIFKNSVNNLETKLYNKLPNYLKNLESLKHFKKNNLKPFCYNRPFIQWMNTCPMCRYPEREFYGKVRHWQPNYYDTQQCMGVINLLVSIENLNTLVFNIILSANEDKRKPGKLRNF
jgi:hypothetical protein